MIRSTLTRLAPAFALALVLATAPAARAQEEGAADPNGDSGRPADGYFVCGALVGAALFAVAKSARR